MLKRLEFKRSHVGILDIEKNEMEFKWNFDRNSEDLIEPMGFSDEGLFYFVGYHDGRLALKSLDPLDEKATEHVVFADPEYDLGMEAIKLGRSSIVGVRHAARMHDYYLVPELQALQDKLDKIIPKAYNQILDLSQDGNRYLLLSKSDVNPGTFYVGDLSANSLTPFALSRRGFEKELLGKTQTIHYVARDGTPIEGFVTLPPNVESPVPIVLRVEFRKLTTPLFDSMNQMLVQAGIGVAEFNFRGTHGHGIQFELASQHRWGLEMQDDLIDGLKYLVAQKIANPERLCIMGKVYGGYAAMMGLMQNPEMFRCAVSINGISDLKAHVDSIPNWTLQPLLKDEIGVYGKDLWDRSPLKYVEKIQAPLLLIHEEDYYGVDDSQSHRMDEALRKLDKPVEYLDIPTVLKEHNEEVTNDLYEGVYQFITKHI